MEQPKSQKNELEKEDKLLRQDRAHLLQYLPSEIWNHVFTKLPKTHRHSSKQTLSYSSPFFRNLLGGEKTTFHFGKVINILANDKTFLQLNDVLNCRQVCKTWNKEIDTIFTKENSKLCLHQDTNHFNTYDKVVHFLDHFKHTHSGCSNQRNPFIDGKITLTFTDEYVILGPAIFEINEHKLRKISKFVQMYDNYINELSISLNLSIYTMFKNVVMRLPMWLLGMYNLRKFSIKNEMLYLEDDEDAEPRHSYLPRPFPKLYQLEELHIDAWFPENIGVQLINRNKHITKLYVENNSSLRINHEYKISRFPPFQNLTYLDINMGSIGNLEDLRMLYVPNLSTLTLNAVRGFNFNEQLKWSTVFPVIETKFSNTLERLSVEMESEYSQALEDTRAFQVYLPKLKEVRLLVRGQSVSLDFLLPMTDTLDKICVMILKEGGVGVEGDFMEMLNFQKLRATNEAMVKFVHFDMTFDDIRLELNNQRVENGEKRTTISDRIILK